jgi:hypothetical protein
MLELIDAGVPIRRHVRVALSSASKKIPSVVNFPGATELDCSGRGKDGGADK